MLKALLQHFAGVLDRLQLSSLQRMRIFYVLQMPPM